MMLLSLLFATLLGQGDPVKVQQPVLGAKEIIRQMQIRPAQEAKLDVVGALKAQSTGLKAKLPTLSASQAADAWLELLKDWKAKTADASDTGRYTPGSTFAEVMMPPLPAPTAWPLIRERLLQLPLDKTRSVIPLFDDLLGRDKDVLKALENRRNPDADPSKEDVFSPETKISDAELPIALRSGDLDLVANIYLRKIQGDTLSWSGFPDIVGQFGSKRAEPLMRKMLEMAKNSVYGFTGAATTQMARTIVLSDLPKLKSPQWTLVKGLDDFPFVAAQVRRFGEGVFDNNGNSEWVLWVYALELSKRGQIDHAIRLLSSHPSPWFGSPESLGESKGQLESRYSQVSNLLDRKQLPGLIPLYMMLGRSLGYMNEVKKRLNLWLGDPTLDGATRSYCLEWRGDIYRSEGNLKEAIEDYKTDVKLETATPGQNPSASATRLLDIGSAIGDTEAVSFVLNASKNMGTAVNRLDFFSAYNSMGRLTEAQDVALKAVQDVHNVNLFAEGHGQLLDAYPNTGVELAELYYKTNQPEQILTLLHEYPRWGAEDLLGLVSYRRGNYWDASESDPLGFYAAWALAKTGQTQTAIRILHAMIPLDPKDDPSYRLLNEVEGRSALTFYDELIKANPFEARPLIWKGDLLLRTSQLQVAEETERAAIALDPTDRSAAHGWRQVAYDILGQILRAEGKRTAATACAQVIKAARITDEARKDDRVGLHILALGLYRKALAIWPQDSLVQVLLAEALESRGRHQDALQEYRKSFDLVLSSEGRISGADPGEDSGLQNEDGRKLAMASLNRLRKSHPTDPGVLFVLGQFQSKSGDDRAALARYEEAVRQDPRYVRAWEEILSLGSSSLATKKQIEDAELALVQLDPLNYRAFNSEVLQRFADYLAIWRAYDRASKLVFPLPTSPLFPLEASKRSLASGTNKAQLPSASALYEGPGAVLASISELQALFP
jgi:tetratricopeptide (TPR) repeat protein